MRDFTINVVSQNFNFHPSFLSLSLYIYISLPLSLCLSLSLSLSLSPFSPSLSLSPPSLSLSLPFSLSPSPFLSFSTICYIPNSYASCCLPKYMEKHKVPKDSKAFQLVSCHTNLASINFMSYCDHSHYCKYNTAGKETFF